MSDCVSQYDNTQAFQILRQRCSDLGLLTWLLDVEGHLIAEPDDLGEAEAWFTSAPLRQRISHGWRQAAGEKITGLIPLMPGCWMLPLIPPDPPVSAETTGCVIADAVLAKSTAAGYKRRSGVAHRRVRQEKITCPIW